MFDIHHLWLFVLSGFLLNIIPGPDSLLILGRGATQGFKAGSAAALGIGTGTMIHISAAALGLSAILTTSAMAFTIVKVIGGVYLIYTAVMMLKNSSVPAHQTLASKPVRASYIQIYRQGLITNLFNPKVAVFFLAFVPQFIDEASQHKPLAFIVLGIIFNVNGMLWCHFLAWASSKASQKLIMNETLKKWLSRSVAGLFGFFGLRLLFASQR